MNTPNLVKELIDEKEAKVVKRKKYVPCGVCYSPWRSQIETALDANIPTTRIAEKYLDKFPGCNKANSLIFKIRAHIAHRDIAKSMISLEMGTGQNPGTPTVTLESFAQKMLDIGGRALEYYEKFPASIDLKDVISAQKLLIDKQKVRVQEDALKIGMAKLFGGFEPETIDIIEGDFVNENGIESKVRILPSPEK